MTRLAQPRLGGPVPLSDSRSDLMHSQFRLSLLQWNPGPACKNDTQIIPAACGRSHAVILQEAGDDVPQIYGATSTLTRTATTSPFCSSRTRSCQAPRSSPSLKPPRSKDTLETCCSCRTWLLASLFCCRLTHGHVLFSPPPQQIRQER